MRRAPWFAALALVAGCALNSRRSLPEAEMAELWVPPTDIEQRNLTYGPGSATHMPPNGGSYEFVELKTTGTQPGYTVKDAGGTEWSVKLGPEARAEVVASRLMWAIGYHQPYVYYLPEWTLVRDGKSSKQTGGRFRVDPGEEKKGWSWRSNPFTGTRPMAGLWVMMVMLNNWDLKPDQNSIYALSSTATVANGEPAARDRVAQVNGTNGGAAAHRAVKPTRVYVVRDLGSSFGKSAWIRMATKGDSAGYKKEGFIKGIEGNRVLFHFQGAWLEPQLHESASPDDVRWLCELLARLSPEQMRDAFRAGGFPDNESAPFIKRLREKIDEGLRVGQADVIRGEGSSK
jgi:hypothetical protein